MLDENLPTYFLKASSSGIKHHRDFYFSYHGSAPSPAYTLQHADPASTLPAQKNCYAAALFDAYNPEVLFGEVLARPGWVQPSLSQEEVRKNGGVPPPPQPVLPSEFTIQLYDPDQQIRVELKEGKWGGSDSYEFSVPVSTFRLPSASNLDRGQSDPASLAITPKVNFVWKKESKLSKDLTCFMTGKSTDAIEKKRSRKDPDIAVALWRSMREMTLYEPNLQRLEIEDPKGLEVVLLLSAVVVKDLYFGNKELIRETFNISDSPMEWKLSGGGRRLSSPPKAAGLVGAPNLLSTLPPQGPVGAPYAPASPLNIAKRNSLPRLQTTTPTSSNGFTHPPPPNSRQTRNPAPPPLPDPRAQWELDAETARLRAQAEAEAREEHRRRMAREKADEAEAKRLQRIVEEEDRQARKRQAEVDRETERLRKMYGVQQLPIRPASSSGPGRPPPQANSSSVRGSYLQPVPQRGLAPPPPQQQRLSNGMYVQQPAAAASSSALMMSGANGLGVPGAGKKPTKKKSSFFGLRSTSDDGVEQQRRLAKKSSAMW